MATFQKQSSVYAHGLSVVTQCYIKMQLTGLMYMFQSADVFCKK